MYPPKQLMLFAADTRDHASHLVLPGSREARKMTAISGRKCLELPRKSSPLGCLRKTLLDMSHWVSTRCFLTWKMKATPQRRLLYRLVPSTPHIDEIECGLLPTVTRSQGAKGAMLLPTPTTQETAHPNAALSKTGRRISKDGLSSHSLNLTDALLRHYPTPKNSDSKGAVKNRYKGSGKEYGNLSEAIRGGVTDGIYPHPNFVEWMMGFPLDWTKLEE